MAKVTWSVPLVQFGRCEVEFDVGGELPEPEKFGAQYADFVAGAMKGFERRQQEIRSGKSQIEIKEEAVAEEVALHDRVIDEMTEERAADLIKSELGATEIAEDAPPWERKNVEKSEPWKSGGPVKKPAKIQW